MNNSQPRVPAGVSTGGRYAHKNRPESQLTLEESQSNWELIAERRRHFIAQGEYVGPLALSTKSNPNATAYRTKWWDTVNLVAEANHSEGAYPRMGMHDSPADAKGAEVGMHRMAYRGAGVELRMPSVASIRRFAAGLEGHTTFDVPVSCVHPGGKVVGWARVTRGEDGAWAVRGLGMSPANATYVAESVQCLIESRRPSRALEETGNLLERRKGRAAKVGTRLRGVTSTWIKRLGYEPGTSTMVMETRRGCYGFVVPLATFKKMLESKAPGSTFSEIVKGKARRVEVTTCPRCERFYVAGIAHRCPPVEASRPGAASQHSVAS